jgi:hypothetical protein
MGVPVETVRSRVRRAVEMLRARLDEQHDGRRAAWLAPLLVGGDKPPTPPTHVGPLVKGVIVMTTAKKVAAAVAALLLLVGGGVAVLATRTMQKRDEAAAAAARTATKPAPNQRTRSRADERNADAAPDATAHPSTPAVDAPAPTKDETPNRTFIARVVDPGGVPVEGVRVFLNQGRPIPAGQLPPTAVSDAQGCARFEIVGQVKTLWIDSESTDGEAFGQRQPQPTIPDDARQVDVVVERRAWIKGRVVTDKGVAGKYAQIAAIQGTQEFGGIGADRDGNFRLVVPPNEVFDLSLTGWAFSGPLEDDRGVLDGKIGGIPSGAVDVVIVARPIAGKGTVRLKTATSAGGPVPGVVLVVRAPTGSQTIAVGKTDASGRFECADVPNRLVCVRVNVQLGEILQSEKDGWITPTREQFVRPGDPEIVFTFVKGVPIRGRVEFCESYPKPTVPGWTRPHAGINVDHVTSSTWSDDDGRFTILVPATSPGPFRISSGVRVMADNRYFEGAVEGVLPGADDVVLKIVETTTKH